jgi:glutathione S-transferase
MLTLIHAPNSRSGRILWLLEELGIPFDVREVGILRGDGSGLRDPANPHPDGKVPALLDDGALVTESLAIALYLAERAPQSGLHVPEGDPDRGAYLSWLAWVAGEMEPVCLAKMYGPPLPPTQQASLTAVTDRVLAAVRTGPYVMGARFTTADVMVGATLLWARAHFPDDADLDAYLARITQRAACQQARARDMAQAA